MFQQGFFQIDPNLTPEELQARRERLREMMPDGRAQYVGEGLGDLASGIFAGITGRKLNKVERENRQKAQELFSGLMGGAPSQAPVTGPLTVLGMPPSDGITSGPIEDGQSVANDTMTALGKTPFDPAANIRAGLIERGLPEHVADAFIMNMRDESGLKTDINEAAPIVPGSRGGYGLIQWTGPRRRQLEAFAAERGTAPSDLNTQLDFLMTELQGPESRAGQAILSTKTAPEAAAVILNDFLRPAEEHRARREAAYLGGPAPTAAPLGAATPGAVAQPLGTAAPGAVAQPAGGMDQLYMALQNPWLNPQQRAVVMSMIQQRQAEADRARAAAERAADPMYQMSLEKAGLELEAMRNPQAKFDASRYKVVGNTLYDLAAEGGPQAVGTGEAGLGQTMEFTLADGTRVRMGENGLPSDIGTIPQGYEAFVDENGQRSMRPVAGGPADTSEKDENKDRQSKLKLGTTLDSLNLNIAEIENGGLPVTGAIGDFRRTGIGRALTGSGAVDFGNRTDQVTTSAALAEVQNMRDNSPTGGAVGQLTDSERIAIGNSVTALNNSTSAEEYLRAAKAYRKLALDLAYGEGMWDFNSDGELVTKGGQSGGMDFSGMSLEELSNIDVNSLSATELEAMAQRFDELGM